MSRILFEREDVLITIISTEVVLADLVKSFRFSEPKAEIVWNCGGIVYPTVGHESNVPSMPILVELVSEPTRPN